MDNAGRTPGNYSSSPADEGGDEDRSAQTSQSIARKDALTHRPRGLANISRQTLADNRAGKHIGTGASITELRPGRKSPPSKSRSDQSASGADLRPLVNQLMDIAEQLRRETSVIGVNGVSLRADKKSTKAPAPFAGADGRSHAGSLRNTGIANRDEVRERNLELARATYAKRRKRTAIFGDPELFGEPAWDILLDLYIAQVEEKPVSVSSACIGSAAPPTTGLRWLGVLAEQGLVLREHDPEDQRRVLVRLTDRAMEAMDEYFVSSASILGDRRAARA